MSHPYAPRGQAALGTLESALEAFERLLEESGHSASCACSYCQIKWAATEAFEVVEILTLAQIHEEHEG